MRVSVLRVTAVLEVFCALVFVLTTEWFSASMCVLLAGYIWAFDNADHERRQLRRSRTVTHTTTVTRYPGESPELFARRIAVELAREVDRRDRTSLRKPS